MRFAIVKDLVCTLSIVGNRLRDSLGQNEALGQRHLLYRGNPSGNKDCSHQSK